MASPQLYLTPKSDLGQAWGKWLSGLADWDWYATLTFRDPCDPARPNWTKPGWAYAKGAWGKFLESLPISLREDGSISDQTFLPRTWVRMFELQRWRGVPHIHALIAGVKDLRRDEAWAWWFQRYGFARILPYDSSLGGASYYLCKYVTKTLGDIDFGGNFQGVKNVGLQSK